MCEYAKFDGDIPICTVDDNKLCTLCVLGNADTYKKAREQAQKALEGRGGK
jgi:hypothetical protein